MDGGDRPASAQPHLKKERPGTLPASLFLPPLRHVLTKMKNVRTCIYREAKDQPNTAFLACEITPPEIEG